LIAVALVAYFALAVAVAALLLLPGIRAAVFDSVAQFHGRLKRRQPIAPPARAVKLLNRQALRAAH
jgi:hypothetical protein